METRTLTLEDRSYTILLPAVIPRMQLANRVAVLLGPLFGGLGSLVQALQAEATEAGWSQFGASFAEALGQVDPLKLHSLFIEAAFASKLTCGDQLINNTALFEQHFSQYPADVYRVTTWTLWQCVVDFFPNSGIFTQAVGEAIRRAVSPSPRAGVSTTGSVAPAGPDSVPGGS